MSTIVKFVKNTKIYKRVIQSNLLSPKLYSKQHPLQFFLQQVQNNQFNRYDTIIRMLAIGEYFGDNDFGWGLYNKMQELRNINNADQNDLISYQPRFEALIENMKKGGYDSTFPIYSNNDNQLMDGSHRLACALYFDEKEINVKRAEQATVDYSWDWFKTRFTQAELDQLKAAFEKVMEKVDIHFILQQVFDQKSQNFGRGNFYQSYDKIEMPGQRPTEKRFDIYKLKKYLKASDSVLDIGCNCGFFSAHTASFVSKVDGIEINPTLCEIGSITRSYLRQYHCNFHCSDFNNYKPVGKYDMIYSFAVHHWIGMEITDYFNKLKLLLNAKGKVIFESQNLETVDKDFDEKVSKIEKEGFRVLERGALKDDGVIRRKFVIFEWNATSA